MFGTVFLYKGLGIAIRAAGGGLDPNLLIHYIFSKVRTSNDESRYINNEVSSSYRGETYSGRNVELSGDGKVNIEFPANGTVTYFDFATKKHIQFTEDNELTDFVTVWRTTSGNEDIELGFRSGYTYNCTVDWGDGTSDIITAWDQAEKIHTYSTPGDHTIIVSGTCEAFLPPTAMRPKFIKLLNLGYCGWKDLYALMHTGTNVNEVVIGNTDTSGCTIYNAFRFTFYLLTSLTSPPDFTGIDTSKGINFQSFCQSMEWITSQIDLSMIDISNATNIADMLNDIGSRSGLVMDDTCGIQNWNIGKVAYATNFANASTFATITYDKILVNWQAQPHQQNVTIHFGNSKYTAGSAAETARDALTADGWIVSDQGPAALRKDGKIIINRTTFGTRDDVILYDDDSVDVNGVPYPDAIVTEYEGQKRVALNPAEPTQLIINDFPKFSRVRIFREEGWQGHLGWRCELLDYEGDLAPKNMAIAVYREPEGKDYHYTTGAFVFDEESGLWGCVCPPGFENGHETINFSLLYGAAKYSVFSLFENFDEMTFDIGGDVL